MEILKKKIEDYKNQCSIFTGFIITHIEGWIKEFEVRQKEYQNIFFNLKKALYKQIESLEKDVALWKGLYDSIKNQPNEYKDLYVEAKEVFHEEKEKFERDKKDLIEKLTYWRNKFCISKDQIINDPSNPFLKQFPWIPIDYPPEDDASVLVIHSSFPEVIHMAYYDGENREFVLLDTLVTTFIACTHWMKIPPLPENA
jgi:hypothetical protein